jgi:PAS domain S-box-containing protein
MTLPIQPSFSPLSSGFFNAIMQHASEAMLCVDSEGVIKIANEACLKLLKYGNKELIDKHNINHLLQDLNLDHLKTRLRQKNNNELTIPCQAQAKGAHLIACFLQVHPIADHLNECVGYFIKIHPEGSPAYNEQIFEKLSLVAEKTNNSVIITDAEGYIEWVNPGFTTLTGYSLEEVIHQKPGSILQGPLTDPEAKEIIREQLKKHVSFSQDLINYNKAGETYWIRLYITPIFDKNQKIAKYIAVQTDITQNKAQEQKLKELHDKNLAQAKYLNDKITEAFERSESDLRALLENTSDGIWSINRQYKIITLNTSAKKTILNLYGITLREGDNLLRRLKGHAPEHVINSYKKLIDRSLSGESFRTELHSKLNEETYYQEVSFHPIFLKNERIDGVSIFSRDITQRKKQENELIESRQNLLEVNQELDTFVYRASHDLKGPLSSMLGLIYLAKMESKGNNTYLELLENKGRDLNNILTKLITATHIKHQDPENENININVLIESIIKELKSYSDYKNASFTILNTMVDGFTSDSQLLRTILFNILENAVVFSKENEHANITISIDEKNSGVHFIIQDQGQGIEEQLQQKVFEMFFRGNVKSKGPGLGLYLASKAISRLSGKLTINSESNQGTAVNIWIPTSNGQHVVEPTNSKLLQIDPFR